MASIYKRKQDAQLRRACWYIGYIAADGKHKTVKGFRDRGTTEQLAAKLEHEAMLRKRGLIDPEQEQVAERRKVPIEKHLTAFQTTISKNSPKHVKLTMARVRRVVTGCGFQTAAEISVEAVETFLCRLAEEEDLGNRTYNHYIQAIDGFCLWLVKTKTHCGESPSWPRTAEHGGGRAAPTAGAYSG